MSMDSHNSENPIIVGSAQKVEMDESTPIILHATAMYSAEPETVTFDESAVVPATAMALGEDDPLFIRATHSADYSAAQSDKVEDPIYRDIPFAILFWIQLIAVIVVGSTIAPKGYEMFDFAKIKEEIENDPSSNPSDVEKFETFVSFVGKYVQTYPERIISFLLYPTSMLAFLIALIITTKLIRPFPKYMVTACLIGAFVEAAVLLGLLVISSLDIGSVIFAMIILSVVAYYIRSVWRLIPHSAVNLGVSLDGVQRNCGIYIVALCLSELGFLWLFYWLYVLVGTMIYVGETQCPGMTDDEDCSPQGWTFLLMILSFYWTSQVISNTIQVTVAGVMATWCFDFDYANNFCSSAVWSSLYRSLTFSFGSICFGSLLMAIVRVLRYLISQAKRQRESRQNDNCDGCEFLICILDCLIKLFEEILDYFNHWSYVFCGIYGYSYLQSGKMVLELFRARGWETIVQDDLIGYVLAFTTFTAGVFTGLGCMGLERIVDAMIDPDPVDEKEDPNELEAWDINRSYLFGPLPNPQYLALGIGFLIGIIVCSIMMNVVRGAVNTLIVCWADSPARMEENHPEATKEMAETWAKAFPEARVQLSSQNDLREREEL